MDSKTTATIALKYTNAVNDYRVEAERQRDAAQKALDNLHEGIISTNGARHEASLSDMAESIRTLGQILTGVGRLDEAQLAALASGAMHPADLLD